MRDIFVQICECREETNAVRSRTIRRRTFAIVRKNPILDVCTRGASFGDLHGVDTRIHIIRIAIVLFGVVVLPMDSPGRYRNRRFSYDNGVKPYDPPNANLLQPFSTILHPNVAYTLKLDLSDPSNTIYELNSSNIHERKVVKHANNCSSAQEGYELYLYFGGQCTAPSTVTVCYTNESSSN